MKEFQYKEVFVVLDGPSDPRSPESVYANVYGNRDDAINCIDVILSFSDLSDRSMSIWRMQINEACSEQDIQDAVRDLIVRTNEGPRMRYATLDNAYSFLDAPTPLSA